MDELHWKIKKIKKMQSKARIDTKAGISEPSFGRKPILAMIHQCVIRSFINLVESDEGPVSLWSCLFLCCPSGEHAGETGPISPRTITYGEPLPGASTIVARISTTKTNFSLWISNFGPVKKLSMFHNYIYTTLTNLLFCLQNFTRVAFHVFRGCAPHCCESTLQANHWHLPVINTLEPPQSACPWYARLKGSHKNLIWALQICKAELGI